MPEGMEVKSYFSFRALLTSLSLVARVWHRIPDGPGRKFKWPVVTYHGFGWIWWFSVSVHPMSSPKVKSAPGRKHGAMASPCQTTQLERWN